MGQRQLSNTFLGEDEAEMQKKKHFLNKGHHNIKVDVLLT